MESATAIQARESSSKAAPPKKDAPLRAKRLRVLARLRKKAAFALLLAPALAVVAVDVVIRGERLATLPLKYVGSYLGAFVESAILWGLLLVAASARRGVGRW